jgi:intermediate peptidase
MKGGLFGTTDIRHPLHFNTMAQEAEAQSNALIDEIARLGPMDGSVILSKLDSVSDVLCLAMDNAEYCRQVHPNPQYQEGASNCFFHLANYMETLNASDVLYNALTQIRASPEAVAALDGSERFVLYLHLGEFEKGGVHLPEDKQELLLDLKNAELHLTDEFRSNVDSQYKTVCVPSDILNEIVLRGAGEEAEDRGAGEDGKKEVLDTILRHSTTRGGSGGAMASAMSYFGGGGGGGMVEVPCSVGMVKLIIEHLPSEPYRYVSPVQPHYVSPIH